MDLVTASHLFMYCFDIYDLVSFSLLLSFLSSYCPLSHSSSSSPPTKFLNSNSDLLSVQYFFSAPPSRNDVFICFCFFMLRQSFGYFPFKYGIFTLNEKNDRFGFKVIFLKWWSSLSHEKSTR